MSIVVFLFLLNIFIITVSLFIQAYRNDELVDPLSDPGNVDIMLDVNFEELTARAMQSSYGKIEFERRKEKKTKRISSILISSFLWTNATRNFSI